MRLESLSTGVSDQYRPDKISEQSDFAVQCQDQCRSNVEKLLQSNAYAIDENTDMQRVVHHHSFPEEGYTVPITHQQLLDGLSSVDPNSAFDDVDLSSEQIEAMWLAHETGQRNEEGSYSAEDLRKKFEILEDAGFSRAQSAYLLRMGVCGLRTNLKTFLITQRLKFAGRNNSIENIERTTESMLKSMHTRGDIEGMRIVIDQYNKKFEPEYQVHRAYEKLCYIDSTRRNVYTQPTEKNVGYMIAISAEGKLEMFPDKRIIELKEPVLHENLSAQDFENIEREVKSFLRTTRFNNAAILCDFVQFMRTVLSINPNRGIQEIWMMYQFEYEKVATEHSGSGKFAGDCFMQADGCNEHLRKTLGIEPCVVTFQNRNNISSYVDRNGIVCNWSDVQVDLVHCHADSAVHYVQNGRRRLMLLPMGMGWDQPITHFEYREDINKRVGPDYYRLYDDGEIDDLHGLISNRWATQPEKTIAHPNTQHTVQPLVRALTELLIVKNSESDVELEVSERCTIELENGLARIAAKNLDDVSQFFAVDPNHEVRRGEDQEIRYRPYTSADDPDARFDITHKNGLYRIKIDLRYLLNHAQDYVNVVDKDGDIEQITGEGALYRFFEDVRKHYDLPESFSLDMIYFMQHLESARKKLWYEMKEGSLMID